MKLFVVDPHTIYRRGLAACLEGLPEVDPSGTPTACATPGRTRRCSPPTSSSSTTRCPAGSTSSPPSPRRRARRSSSAARTCTEEAVLAALQAGAAGVLRKETLTTESLASAVRAAASGTGVVTSELLRELLDGLAPEYDKPVAARLTDREQQVLSLIAAGHPTREVAQQLCYSERTVKNVLHDVVTKLNARSRSQAVAHAVREGLI